MGLLQLFQAFFEGRQFFLRFLVFHQVCNHRSISTSPLRLGGTSLSTRRACESAGDMTQGTRQATHGLPNCNRHEHALRLFRACHPTPNQDHGHGNDGLVATIGGSRDQQKNTCSPLRR
jgi:hypothetical protein